ncbi:Protein kintoun [Orchesella cincta]|uniref:Protein kintoun n=1 Tax=Orchesella cincta TaxID=48709 RepID=A0A1D2N051_ORCCI|nr:Protein kintoun [Orchesella cincta]
MTQNEQECNDFSDILFPPDNDPDKDDFCMTRSELDKITEAFKDEGFRKLFVEYVEEMQDPETQATYQREMRQLELERGNIVHFINPVPGYVLKSSVNGEKKGFINICSNPLIKRASFQSVTKNDEKGNMWSIPYAQSPPREDVDKSGSFCIVYDVIFHPDTLAMARKESLLRDKLETTAIESVEKSFNVTLDRNNVKKPKLRYKGLARATAIKYKMGGTLPPVIDPIAAKNELPPQRTTPLKREQKPEALKECNGTTSNGAKKETPKASSPIPVEKSKKNFASAGAKEKPKLARSISDGNEGDDDESWTEPRYSIKYRSHIDMQDYSLDNRKVGKTIPDELILTIDLPLLRDSSTLDADVVDGGLFFELKSELRARYKLKLKLPYQVHGDSAKATFDKDKRKLSVTLRVVHKKSEKPKVLPSSEVKEGSYLRGEGEVDLDENDDETFKDLGGAGDACFLPGKPVEVISTWANNEHTIKGILKRKEGRVRSLSESFVDKMTLLRTGKDESISLESLNEEVESDEVLSASPTHEKSVRFSDSVQRQLYRSNSSILGQKKKNQRKNKNKKKARERANSEGSASSLDADADDEDHGYTSSSSIVGLGHPFGNASSRLKKRELRHDTPLSSSVD